MENIVKVHVNMKDVVAAAEYLFVWNDAARHKFDSFSDWYNFIMDLINKGVTGGDEICSSGGVMITFERLHRMDYVYCHVDIFVSAQFEHDNYVTYDVEV